jgi:ubiquinone/menaquinone biosynthesis C-methylase UbiE
VDSELTNNPLSEKPRPICDYEGSTYRTDFWEGQGREYEDLAERIALHKLLPPTGGRLLDVGAGFGRLADLYAGYDEVILLDYSTSLLQEARGRLGRDPRYRCVAANFYHLPFVDGLIETVVMVRVLHHAQDVPAVLDEIARVVRARGHFVLEYANKRHVKAMLRYLLRRQAWSPFDRQPVEFVALNFDFHPAYVRQHLAHAGFAIQRERAVSAFRLPLLKRTVPSQVLAALDGLLQRPLAALKPTPSVLLCSRREGSAPGAPLGVFFRCPACRSADLVAGDGALICRACARHWPIVDGVHDFRWPRGATVT